MVRRPSPQASGFDGRADDFDRRSAPPGAVADEIARAVDSASRDSGGAGESDALLDLGAGTGVLGAPLARLCCRRGAPYVGLDLSLGQRGSAIGERRQAGRQGPPVQRHVEQARKAGEARGAEITKAE